MAATLPQTYIDTTYSLPVGGNTHTPDNATELNTLLALNELDGQTLALGDVIVLDADTTYTTTSNFVLPDLGAGTDWVYIISSRLASLPAAGVRVGTADAANMPTLHSATNGVAIIRSEYGSHHFRIVGIQMTYSVTPPDYLSQCVLLSYNSGGTVASTDADFSHNIVFDRCLIHGGGPTNVCVQGMSINGKSNAVIDSHIEDTYAAGGVGNGDGQAVHTFRGIGPYKINNNYLCAGGEVILIGNDDTWPGTTFAPADIEIRYNTFFKRDTWNANSASWDGYARNVKNMFELKVGQRVLFEGNDLTNIPYNGGQYDSLVLTPRDNSVKDITVRYNVWRVSVDSGDTIGFARIIPPNISGDSHELGNVTIHDNLVMNHQNYGVLTGEANDGHLVGTIEIYHNTFDPLKQTIYIGVNNQGPSNFIFRDNLMRDDASGSSYPITHEGGPNMLAGIQASCDAFSFDKNVCITGDSAIYAGSDPDWGTFYFPANDAAVGFTDTSFDDIADYKLLDSSAYYQDGTDGKDIGADLDAIAVALAGVEAAGTTYYVLSAGGLCVAIQTG